MLSYLICRLLRVPFVLFVVSLVLFTGFHSLPPSERGPLAYDSARFPPRPGVIVLCGYRLDRPLYLEYLLWMRGRISPMTGERVGGILNGDLGYSRTASQPVMELVKQRLPATAEIALFATILLFFGGLGLGALAVLAPHRFVAYPIRLVRLVGCSVPIFLVGLLGLVVGYATLDSFPLGRLDSWAFQVVNGPTWNQHTHLITIDALLNGRLDIGANALLHLLAPALTLSYLSWPSMVRVTRTSILEVRGQACRMTVRAKGLQCRSILPFHVLPKVVLPVVTIAGTTVGTLLSGAVIVETLFQYPGLGETIAQAAAQLDVATLLSLMLVFAPTQVITHLLVDLAHLLDDPRVRLD